MSVLVKLSGFRSNSLLFHEWHCILSTPRIWCSNQEDVVKEEDQRDEFRVLHVLPRKQDVVVRKTGRIILPIPDLKMNENSDWTNIWVGPRTFDPYMVPIPIRQGYVKKGCPPDKYSNAELMKIPNFLHLSPQAVEKHCEVLKKFCTEWPSDLKTEEDMNRHFPLTIIASDYCNSLPTIRDPLARIVTFKVKVSDLELDKHAKDKFLRLVGMRYDPKSDYLTLTAQNCPIKKQNYDHALYILTALCFESWKKEDWEDLKSEEDMEEYIFEKRKGKRNLDAYFAYNNDEVPDTTGLAKVMYEYMNQETSELLDAYKDEIVKVLGLPKFECENIGDK